MPRTRVLDDENKREVVALVTAGMSMEKVARYVGCARKTIYRARQVDKEFDFRLRRARMAADLNPLEAMRRAAGTHWRAAAWMLEREERLEADRRTTSTPSQFTHEDLEAIAFRVTQLVRSRQLVDLSEGMPLVEAIDEIFRRAEPGATGPKSRPLPAKGPTVEESIALLDQRWSDRAAGDPNDLLPLRKELADATRPEANFDPKGSEPTEPQTANREKTPIDAG